MDDNKKFKPTTEWMELNYAKLNKELFNNELGQCILRPFTTGKGANGRTLGWFKITRNGVKILKSTRELFWENSWGDRTYVSKYNFFNVCEPAIELNANYSWTEHAMLATLAHEMCHYYTYMNGYAPKQGHGPEFYNIGRIVSQRSNGMFTIQRLASAEQMNEMELDPEIKAKNDQRLANKKSRMNVIFVYKNNGEIQMSMSSSMDLINHIKDVSYTEGERLIKISNDPKLIEFLFSKAYKKNMRTWRYWNVENKPWINDLSKYKYIDTIGDDDTSNEQTTEEQPIETTTKQPKRMFRLKLTNGKTFETEGMVYAKLKRELQAKFPNMKEEVIDKLINNPNNYYTIDENKSFNLDKIIKESIDNYLLREFDLTNRNNDDDSVEIDPNMNLGLESPLEMQDF